ncbi:hypothetical protein MYX06_03975 [Patescibacteria group bacterium AH-259-L05]|nr:hypothetical protein [Patescibacteria group bacterium AH-259-L05]
MKKRLIFAVMIGLTTTVFSQTANEDSTDAQNKSLITVYTNRAFQYAKYGFSTVVDATNAVIRTYDNTDVNNTGWNASIDWVYLESLWRPNLVTEFDYTVTYVNKVPSDKNKVGYYGIDYGMEYNPIFVTLAKQRTPVFHISHRWSQAEIGFRTWQFNGSRSLANTLSSNPAIISEDGTVATYNRRGASMFGEHVLFPVRNEDTLSGATDVYWWASNMLKLRTRELYLAKPISSSLDLMIGLRYVSSQNAQRVGQFQRAYASFYGDWWWDNRINLDLVSKTAYEAKGPTIGLQFSHKFFKVLFVDAKVSYSRLTGDSNWEARWTDVDDVEIPYKETGQVVYEVLYNGDFPYSVSTQEITTALEWQLNLNSPNFYPVKGVTKTFKAISRLIRSDKVMSNLFNSFARFTARFEDKTSARLNLGWFESSFNDMPVAAEYVFPGDWTVGDGTHWDRKKQDLNFNGVSVGFSFNF